MQLSDLESFIKRFAAIIGISSARSTTLIEPSDDPESIIEMIRELDQYVGRDISESDRSQLSDLRKIAERYLERN